MCMGDPSLPDPGNYGECCAAAALYGPSRCTCWKPVHDLPQTEPDPLLLSALKAGCPPSVRPSMCGDCAYRPGSPEKSRDPLMAGSPESLEALALSGGRRSGVTRASAARRGASTRPARCLEVGPGAYDPPIVGGIPWQADGQPGQMCAGWDARRRAHAALGGLHR